MKKVLKSFILFIMFLPILIKAEPVKYSDAIDMANHYLQGNAFSSKGKYIVQNSSYYEYTSSGLHTNSNFKKGGLLNKYEYEISIRDGRSYLSPGLQYWTMTSYNSSNQYYVENSLQYKGNGEKSGVRVTEFVRSDVKIKGTGSYSDPWVFARTNTIQISSDNTKYGYVGKLGTTEKLEGMTVDIAENTIDYSFLIYENLGYKYKKTNGCSVTLTGNIAKINNIKNDLICVVTFDKRIYRYTLNASDGIYTTPPSPSILYLVYGDKWYSDEGVTPINRITPPTRSGYIFKGYYTGQDGAGTKVIDEEGNIISGKEKIVEENDEDQVLYAYWNAAKYTVTFDSNGGNAANPSTKEVTYGENYGTLATSTKDGSSLSGWYTSPTGGTKVTETTQVTNTNNHTLYAQWISCGPGTYLSNGACVNCAVGSISTGVTNTSCTPCGAGKTTSALGKSSCDADCPAIEGLNTWASPTWNSSNNTVSDNICKATKCNAGYKLENGTCVPCGPGTFASSAGATSCTNCVLGSYSSGSANTACIACNNGKTTSSSGKSNCDENCAEITGLSTWATASWNTNNTVSNSCKLGTCAAGYKLENGACVKCPAGTHSSAGSTTCTTCPAGTYSVAGSSTCSSCPSGYTSAAGATSQTSCYIDVDAGKYKTTSTGSTTQNCAAGTYIDAHKSYYNSTDLCTSCPGGYTSDAGSTVQTNCYVKVTAGKYKTAATGSTTQNCAAGTYKEAHKSYYNSSDLCTSCPDGYTSDAGSDEKTDCIINCSANTRVASADAKCSSCASGLTIAAHTVHSGSTSAACTYTNVTVVVNGAVSETISYVDQNDSSNKGTITTNSNATATNVTLRTGTYTFTSNVAKEFSDLVTNYSKTVTITSSTTVVNFYPTGALYWWGNGNPGVGNLAAGITAGYCGANGSCYNGTHYGFSTRDFYVTGTSSSSTLRSSYVYSKEYNLANYNGNTNKTIKFALKSTGYSSGVTEGFAGTTKDTGSTDTWLSVKNSSYFTKPTGSDYKKVHLDISGQTKARFKIKATGSGDKESTVRVYAIFVSPGE